MPPLIQVSLRLSKRELTPALKELGKYSSRLPSELVNKAVYSIAIRAQRNMPVVPASKIQTQLEEYRVPVYRYSRKGKLLHVGKSKPVFGGGSVPFLALLLNARVNPGSIENRREGNVFQLAQSPWKGVSRAVGAERMLEAMRKMFAGRVRSTGFFRVCAQAVQLFFKKFAGAYQNSAGSGTGRVSKAIGKVASGTPAVGSSWNAKASFWVASTEPDTKGTPGQALTRIAEPVWQKAVDDESASIRKEAERRYREVIRQAGFIVK